jgi:hypothetical protein
MIIATRYLTAIEDDQSLPVRIDIHAPEKEDRAWICRFEIGWPKAPRQDYCLGFDAVQALDLAFKKIGAELYGSAYHAAGKLIFLKRGDGYGFPIIRSSIDLLVGEDKEAYTFPSSASD